MDQTAYSMFNVDGKVVLITGAAQGMGEAAARLFAAAGSKVVVADLNEELGQEVVKAIQDAGGEASFVKADVSKEADVKAMVDFCVDTYGELNVAINNAAAPADTKPLAEMDVEDFDRSLAINLRGPALCMKYEIQQMIAQKKGGSIVNTSSNAGIRPQANEPAYVASKHGLIGLTKQAALDYSQYDIRINTVSPGSINTPRLVHNLKAKGFEPRERAEEMSMLGRFGEPEEIAKTYLWLASDMSSFVTGTNFSVDGGYVNK